MSGRARGKNAASLLWDDSLGAGLQMALFDAVARACDVPIHRLLGAQAHERTPLSWWNIDTYPEDMAAECKAAYRQGYLAYKTKGRPWFDIYEQIDPIGADEGRVHQVSVADEANQLWNTCPECDHARVETGRGTGASQ